MIWYVFDMTGFSEPLHQSLTRTYVRASRREGSAGTSHFYAACTDHELTPARYYLHTADDRVFVRMIRQFGGRRAVTPPKVELKEIRREDDLKAPAPDVDTPPC